MEPLYHELDGISIILMRRMESADAKGNSAEEGVQVALELIERIRAFEGHGVHGLHIMAVGWEEIVPRIVMESGLAPHTLAPTKASGVAESAAAQA